MRLSSPRWRVLVLAVVAAVAGRLLPEVVVRVTRVWVTYFGGACPATPAGETAADGSGCASLPGKIGPVDGLELGLALLGVALLVPATWWALRPLRDAAAVVADVGPNSLGRRLTASRFGGETATLAQAVNGMLERVAVGYESQRRFAAAASHELRTPLAVQRVLIEVGLANGPSPEKVEVVAEQLLAANERNVRLIEALLVLSESDRGLAGRSPLRLDLIVDKVLVEHGAQAAEAGLEINSTLQPRTVVGEQVLLERLVTNLVQNAIKYNRPGGTIDVAVAARPALTIANTGDDVPASAVDRLFEPFQRLGGDRMARVEGVGLGLTIVRSIVRAHDGAVSARSTGRDGLRFEISLPDT